MAGLLLKDVLIKMKKPADSEGRHVSDFFTEVHADGRNIVANIESLASAQEEDRRMAKCLRRQTMRRAKTLQGEQSPSDDGIDSSGSGSAVMMTVMAVFVFKHVTVLLMRWRTCLAIRMTFWTP
jgi:hypothetical protein